jgi:hypothetical protein
MRRDSRGTEGKLQHPPNMLVPKLLVVHHQLLRHSQTFRDPQYMKSFIGSTVVVHEAGGAHGLVFERTVGLQTHDTRERTSVVGCTGRTLGEAMVYTPRTITMVRHDVA